MVNFDLGMKQAPIEMTEEQKEKRQRKRARELLAKHKKRKEDIAMGIDVDARDKEELKQRRREEAKGLGQDIERHPVSHSQYLDPLSLPPGKAVVSAGKTGLQRPTAREYYGEARLRRNRSMYSQYSKLAEVRSCAVANILIFFSL